MRINTPIDKERLKNHITYSIWKYVLMAVLCIMGWSLLYTTTAYRSPQDKRIDVYVMTNTATQDTMDPLLEKIWHEVTPDMETVGSVALLIGDDYITFTQLTTYIAAGDGDIYFVTEQFFKNFAAQGAFLPLDELVANGTIDASGVDLSKGYVTEVLDYDINDVPTYGEKRLFGIPLESFYGYMNGMKLDNRGLYATILAYNQNDENVIPFFNALLQEGRAEMEDWIIN